MTTTALVLVATAILGYGVISRRAETLPFSPPMIFVALGVLIGTVGMIDFEIADSVIHALAEITLVLVLFTDASRIDLRRLRREQNLPLRLLLIGLPLTIGLGTLFAIGLFPALSIWGAALLAAVLAPTDAALGQAVVSSPKVPVRIRQTLNVESGLNDGIALPVVLLFMSACAAAQGVEGGAGYWLRFAALQVTLGPLVGAVVGVAGGKLVQRATTSGWMNHAFQHLSALGLAFLAFAGAELIGGNGFIAAFVAGMALGNTTKEICDCLYDFAEAEGQLLTLLVFMVFGAVLLPHELAHIAWPAVVYAVLSLTVVRMLPVALSLIGSGVRWPTTLFVGWFGPRGIASILFGLLVVEGSGVAGSDQLFGVVVSTVLLSVIAHGITAYPLACWYSRHTESLGDEAQENQPVEPMRVRIRHGLANTES